MEWNADDYDHKHDFVFKYGEKLLDYLPSEANKVLDIGCGTGELTAQIAARGYEVKGIDQSENMVQKAQLNFPNLDFVQGDILKMSLAKESFDTVFSNAVFHWINDQPKLVERIHTMLKPGGLLICEFGAKGNIDAISTAFSIELNLLGKTYQSPFYFPSVSEYTALLKQNNFEIITAYEYARPTTLKDGYSGLRNWVKQFFATDLAKLDNSDTVLEHLEDNLKDKLWKEDHWEADYRRIRVVAKNI
ncbi:methyltransferase domain protein [Liquorilactobacillus aquaticus DSM 21051]|uniref:Methyltransferase domain protein n=1 Tax=Liquorilactobacillus aquaticus DSM 21051 TaxID=1423725 RepID=A0A0R2CZ46_9LACO|nr:class I SAM-dependent methyltransferase [Liquorilactobacillus aquaticus]KRM97112.1 methyltransferase domain protein [Liquorilactobacillus aquaticus DSM 21051]